MTDLTTTDILSMQEDEIAALKTKYKELKDTYKDFVLVAKERLEAWRAYGMAFERWLYLDGILDSVRLERQRLIDMQEIIP